MSENYGYLNEERIKLWAELRKTQEQLHVLMAATSPSDTELQTALAHIGNQAARAYKRIIDRDADVAERLKKVEELSRKIDELLASTSALQESASKTSENVAAAEEKVRQGLSAVEGSLEKVSEHAKGVEDRLSKADLALEEVEKTQAGLDKAVADVGEKHDACANNYKEIAKEYSLLFGYTRNDGEVVEGRLQELRNASAELEGKITKVKADADALEKDYQCKSEALLGKAQDELNRVVGKLRELMPDALTAGLSSAYQKNRENEEGEQKNLLRSFKHTIMALVILALLPIAVNLYMFIFKDFTFGTILRNLPKEMLCVLPLYAPLLWLAVFSNRRVNLSKRLIEEYKHKESVSKTYEGLARQIEAIDDEKISKELQARLLYNTVMLSEKNPGELIKNFNRPDNPLLDVLNQSSKFACTIEKLSRVPGFARVFHLAEKAEAKRQALSEVVEMTSVTQDE